MSTATEMLAAYQGAELAILQGKTVSFGGRTLSMENLAEIRKGRLEWERRVAAEPGGACQTAGGLGFAVATYGNNA